jgi:L-lysine 2,3-aminomutase
VSPSWQQQVAQADQTPETLASTLQLPSRMVVEMMGGDLSFPIRATQSYLSRIEPGNPDDPLLRQILPTTEEQLILPGFSQDPVGDQAALQSEGLLQKYRGRALLITTPNCAIHCRYCFRRHYPYRENHRSHQYHEPLRWIASEATLDEVILSGGDPLLLSDSRLSDLLERLESIAHLKTLRIHTRVPVVLPDRVTSRLIQRLESSRLNMVMVLHSNHPNELDHAVEEALNPLRGGKIILLNQSVLLRQVNDRIDTLEQLSQRLFALGVLPYYLHQLDHVQGGHHFEVQKERAIRLIEGLRERLPGYLVPRLVEEIEGATSKCPLE